MSTITAPATSTGIDPDIKLNKAQKKSILASTLGQVLEWYEWGAYSVFAPVIAAYLFDPNNPTASLLNTFGVFAVGFLMRPLGGIIFGWIADRKGRKYVLIMTLLIMATASVIIGIMPGYEKIGIWAAIILLILRMVQGLAHGGESAAANSYVSEIAPRKRRGMWGSVVYMSIFGGNVIAFALGGGINTFMSEDTVNSWGWRIPFLLGAVLALVTLWLRRGMVESEEFEKEQLEQAKAADTNPATQFTQTAAAGRPKGQLRGVLLVIGMVCGLTTAHYVWSSYVATYAKSEMGMDPTVVNWFTALAQFIALVSLPFWGRLSDKIGRKPLMYGFAILMAIVQFPMMALISSAPWTLLVASTVSLVIVAMTGAIVGPVMSEVFPTANRTRNIGLAYSISVAVFGGSAPYLNQLANNLDIGWMASAYVVFTCIITLIAVRMLPETRGMDLSKVE